MADPQTVVATDPNSGQQYNVPLDQVSWAKDQGWDVENPLESTGNELKTAALGAVNSLPFGPKLVSPIVPIEEQNKLRATNPGYYAGGNVAGAVGLGAGIGGLLGAAGEAGELGQTVSNAAAEGLTSAAGEVSPAAEAAQSVAEGTDAATAAANAGGTEGAVNAAADAAAQAPATLEEAQAAATTGKSILQNPYVQAPIIQGTLGGVNYINEAELGDHDFNAAGLVHDVGLNAIIGLGGEAALNWMGKAVVPKVLQRADQALDDLQSAGGKVFDKAVSKLNNVDEDLVQNAKQAIKEGSAPFTDKDAELFAEGINTGTEAVDDASKRFHQEDRPAQAEKNLADLTRDDVLGPETTSELSAFERANQGRVARQGLDLSNEPAPFAFGGEGTSAPKTYDELIRARMAAGVEPPEQVMGVASERPGSTAGPIGPRPPGLRQVADTIEANIEAMRGDMEGGAKKALGKTEDAFKTWKKALSNPDSTANDLHQATLQFSRAVADSGIYPTLKSNLARDVNPGLWNAMKSIEQGAWAPLKDAMGDANIWGAKQAATNQAIDAATTARINAKSNLLKALGFTDKEIETGNLERYIKPSKLRDALNMDPLRNQEKLQALGEYLDTEKKYLEVMKSTAGDAGAIRPDHEQLQNLMEQLTNTRRAAADYGPVLSLKRAVQTQGALGIGAIGAGPLTGSLAHSAGLGLGPAVLLGAGVSAARAPVRSMQAYYQIANAAAAARKAIGSGVKAILSNQSLKSAIAAQTTKMLTDEKFSKDAKKLTALANDQSAQMANLNQGTARLNQDAPNTAMAVKKIGIAAIQELWANLPRNPVPSALPSENKDWKPSPDQLHQWNELQSAVKDPSSYLKTVAAGTANPAVWASLQRVYPAWTREVQSATIDHLAEHPNLTLTESQKMAVSNIIGRPVSPTVAPDAVAFQQALYVPVMPQGRAGGRSSGVHEQKPTQGGLAKIDLGERSALGTQHRR